MNSFCLKLDSIIQSIFDDVLNITNLFDIVKCPVMFLDQLGYMINAGILQTDSETTKRIKIKTAIASHKKRGSWKYHVKSIIDSITLYSAVIFRGFDSDDWIQCGDGILEVGTDWAVLGGDGTSPYGMSLIGEGTEIEIQGNIYIDCHDGVHVSTLTANQIQQIRDNISIDIVPAYMRIYLGYVDLIGSFVVYPNGVIA
jgi:hypothetical protein